MAPRGHLATANQFPYVISLVPHPRNPPLYRSTITRTRRPVIQGHEFWPERYAHLDQIDVRGSYANVEIVRYRVTTRAYVCGISFDLTPTLIIEALGIPREHQPGFPYVVGAAPKVSDLARALRHDRSDVFRIIGARLT
ncbi:hypothetical protein F0562_022362 [Nyssa sinensis]|uniref:Uncharacterized protein n=1 Tax=Nyssa sinensis TaxID=561372 RepID=A0A5J5BQH3_9ASTE|nr:hypothetical protein F0562_022362 [Nyssa sinensis]